MMLNLAQGLAGLGCTVDLIAVKTKSKYLSELPDSVSLYNLGASHTFGSIVPLARYLRTHRLSALLSAKDRANIAAIVARRLSGTNPRLVIRMGTTVSAALGGNRTLRERLWYLRMRIFYPAADAVVAVSQGVALDLRSRAKIPQGKLNVIHNPVVTPGLLAKAEEPIRDDWFSQGHPPVILGVGRLTRQKDFTTLVKAFAQVRRSMACRLVILGEGRDRSALESLSARLGLQSDVRLPGFTSNPYPYMKGASVFVLSSRWEGSPNVLTEALALGTPVVSTDCPNGPREILQGGKFGPLVPVGDSQALAHAILETLRKPHEKSLLKSAVSTYTLEESSKQYLELLLGSGNVKDSAQQPEWKKECG